jgi:hypothetical protein
MSFDRENQERTEFERSLLESARADAPPQDPEHAWARFAGALSLVVPGQAGAGQEAPVSASATTAGTVAKLVSVRAARGAVVKWLLLGALGGSAVTAAVIAPRRDGKPDSPKPVLYQEPPAADAAHVPLPVLIPSHEPVPTSESRTASPVMLAKHSDQGRARPIQHQPVFGRLTQTAFKGDSQERVTAPPGADLSTLAAEVSRIDAARRASAGSDNDESIRLIERYHQDFPKGALAPDADVVALEALAAKGDKAEVARRAALFLSRYPGDPHAARVRWLAEH